MESTPGLCRNTQACALARSGEQVAVPLYDPFVCPDCGAPLVPPALPVAPARALLPLPLALAALLAMVAGAAAWRHATRVAEAPHSVTLAAVTLAAAQGVTAAPSLSAAPELTLPGAAPDAPAVQAQASIPAAAPAPASKPASGPDQPFDPVPLTGGAPAYPASLAANGTPGRVRVACTISPAGVPTGCKARADRGGPLFPPAVLRWLAHGVTYAPVTRNGHPVQVRTDWRVAVTESPQARQTARQAARVTANRPSPVTQPASTLALDGGHPQFPDQYYESDWMSTVTVDCMILADGKPSNCREDRREGSTRFADAVLQWLHDPRTRFEPATRQGRRVDARRIWQIGFTP